MNAMNHDVSALSAATALAANVVPFPSDGGDYPTLDPVAASIDADDPDADDGLPDSVDIADDPNEIYGAGHAIVARDDLANALSIAKHVTERRNTIPILSNAKLIASSGGLAVVATDLDMEITVAVSGAVDACFGTTLPAHMLESFLKKAPASDMVALQSRGEAKRPNYRDVLEWQTEGRATLDFERVQYDLDALPLHNFPSLDAGAFTHRFTMAGAAFRDMLAAVRPAVSTEETRYYLNGVYLHTPPHARKIDAFLGKDLNMVAVATDGHRLYKQDVPLPEGAAGMPGAILPRKLVDLILKLLRGKDCPESVSVAVSDKHCRLQFGAVTILSKLIDGTFPDYPRVIPADNDKLATFDSATMQEALSAVMVMSNERGRAVKLSIAPGRCELTVQNPNAGRAVSSIVCGFSQGAKEAAPLEIGFNGGYLTGLLADFDGEVIGEFGDAGSPTVFRGGRKGFLAVLMPMRV